MITFGFLKDLAVVNKFPVSSFQWLGIAGSNLRLVACGCAPGSDFSGYMKQRYYDSHQRFPGNHP
jgi:hypothetical protein